MKSGGDRSCRGKPLLRSLDVCAQCFAKSLLAGPSHRVILTILKAYRTVSVQYATSCSYLQVICVSNGKLFRSLRIFLRTSSRRKRKNGLQIALSF